MWFIQEKSSDHFEESGLPKDCVWGAAEVDALGDRGKLTHYYLEIDRNSSNLVCAKRPAARVNFLSPS